MKKGQNQRGEKVSWDDFCKLKYRVMLTKEMCNTVDATC